MEITRSLCSKELRKLDVIDTSGEKIGRIGDLTFTFQSGELKLAQFILAGPRFEEFLEAIKVKPDRDPVFDISLVKKLGDKVHLDTSANSLKTTLDDCAISDDEIRLSQLEKFTIYDRDGGKVGKAIDVDFDVDGSASIIVGGGFFEEKLEALGLKADVDLIVPASAIDSITDRITLNVCKDDLNTTMEGALKPEEVKKAKEQKHVHHDMAKVRLFSHRPM